MTTYPRDATKPPDIWVVNDCGSRVDDVEDGKEQKNLLAIGRKEGLSVERSPPCISKIGI